MSKKPTYEELEQKIKTLEKQAVSGVNTINVSGINMEWDVDQGKCTFENLPVAMMWIDTTLAGLMSGAQAMVGTERFRLALQSEGRKSVEADWQVISQFSDFKEGFKAISNIAAVAGWGDWKLISLSNKDKECRFQVADMAVALQKLREEIEVRQRAEERFRELAELLPEPIFEMDVNGNLTFVNRSALEHFRYTQQDFERGKNAFDMIIPEDRQRALENFQKVLTGENVGLREYTALRKDGSTYPAMLNSTAIFRDGKPVGVRGIIVDISERKKAEKAIRESELKFRNLFDLSPQAIALTSMDTGELIDVNDKFCELTKYTKEEILGKTTTGVGFYSEEDRDKFVKNFQKYGEVSGLEMEFRTKDGSILTALMFARPIQISGETFVLTIFYDVTGQKQLEAQLQQAQKMEAIGTLAGGIAHDFNNLLMGIQGRTSLMMSDTDSSHPHNEHLEGIEGYVKSAVELTNQLLAFARGGKYEVRPTDLNKLVKSQNSMFGRTRKEITIRGKYEENLWSAAVDQGQIEQVLLNLYVNAWQSMPGGGNLYIQTANVTLDENHIKPFEVAPGRYVKISVTDTGGGMDEATQQRIFEPFFTTKEMGRGTGLGLASVYGIIKSHGGFIDIYSKKGKGSTFNLYLPASGKKVIEEVTLPKDVLTGAGTVLLVDDEKMITDVGKPMLEKLGYNTLVARSGKDAIEIYKGKKDQIDIVILDMIMPEMGGGDTYDKLRKVNPEIKVILSSGYRIDGQATEILDRGCDGFIQKPFSMKDLSQKIREILNKK